MSVIGRTMDCVPSRWFGVEPGTGSLPKHRMNVVARLKGKFRSAFDPVDLLHLLIQNRDCKTSDPRDKIYGMLGLGKFDVVPDYGISIEQVYISFASNHIEDTCRRRRLEEITNDDESGCILSLVLSAGSLNQKLSLPSWVPDWSVDFSSRPLWPVNLWRIEN